MNQLCKVCGEPAAGFHFGAFTCEGCKSFFGRTYNNISAIAGCKHNGECVINKKNRTACKACRLRKCLLVGMSKSGSRYGRRSNWFKIHCLLQEQQSVPGNGPGGGGGPGGGINEQNSNRASLEQLARLHQLQARQTYQDKTNPCIKSASMSPTALALSAAAAAAVAANSNRCSPQTPAQHNLLSTAAKFLNGVTEGGRQHHMPHQQQQQQHLQQQQHQQQLLATHQQLQHGAQYQQHAQQLLPAFGVYGSKAETRLSETPSDSGASSAGDAADDAHSSISGRQERNCNSAQHLASAAFDDLQEAEARERRHQQLLQIYRSHSEPLHSPFAHFALPSHISSLGVPPTTLLSAGNPTSHHLMPAALKEGIKRVSEAAAAVAAAAIASVGNTSDSETQEEPIDLSVKGREVVQRLAAATASAEVACNDQRTVHVGSNSHTPTTPPPSTASPAPMFAKALSHAVIH